MYYQSIEENAGGVRKKVVLKGFLVFIIPTKTDGGKSDGGGKTDGWRIKVMEDEIDGGPT